MATSENISVQSLSITCEVCGLEMQPVSVVPGAEPAFYTFECVHGHRHEARESERYWGAPGPSDEREARISYLDDMGMLCLWPEHGRLFVSAAPIGHFSVREAIAYIRAMPANQWHRVADMYTSRGLVSGDRLVELAAA